MKFEDLEYDINSMAGDVSSAVDRLDSIEEKLELISSSIDKLESDNHSRSVSLISEVSNIPSFLCIILLLNIIIMAILILRR